MVNGEDLILKVRNYNTDTKFVKNNEILLSFAPEDCNVVEREDVPVPK